MIEGARTELDAWWAQRAPPDYEEVVLHFLATRKPWNSGPTPVIGDPLFIPLHEELMKQREAFYEPTKEGKPWKYSVPTSLIYLQDSGIELPVFPDEPEA